MPSYAKRVKLSVTATKFVVKIEHGFGIVWNLKDFGAIVDSSHRIHIIHHGMGSDSNCFRSLSAYHQRLMYFTHVKAFLNDTFTTFVHLSIFFSLNAVDYFHVIVIKSKTENRCENLKSLTLHTELWIMMLVLIFWFHSSAF